MNTLNFNPSNKNEILKSEFDEMVKVKGCPVYNQTSLNNFAKAVKDTLIEKGENSETLQEILKAELSELKDYIVVDNKTGVKEVLYIRKSIEEILEKGGKGVIGEVRTWKDGKYKKTSEGWVKVVEAKKEKEAEKTEDKKGESKEKESGKIEDNKIPKGNFRLDKDHYKIEDLVNRVKDSVKFEDFKSAYNSHVIQNEIKDVDFKKDYEKLLKNSMELFVDKNINLYEAITNINNAINSLHQHDKILNLKTNDGDSYVFKNLDWKKN